MTLYVSHHLNTLARRRIWAPLAIAALLAACASPSHRAPIEERVVKPKPASSPVPAAASTAAVVPTPAPVAEATVVPSAPAAAAATAPVVAVKPPSGIENLGKPGYYQVKPGDTIIRIGLETGQNWRDIVRWNNIENPNVIEAGHVLRVVAPGADATAATTRPVAPVPSAAAAPVAPAVAGGPAAATTGRTTAPAASAAAGVGPATGAPAGTAVAAAPPTPAAATPAPSSGSGDDDVPWIWPAGGPVLSGFDESRSKGLAIGGKAGDPVLAAADGRVVYAGSGLRGYGNLVIVKHNNTFLTAYAHNQALLVKEDQTVKRGQRIADMGSTDAERVQLHFEIRRQGRPIDPSRLLPAR
jgi:lipoprotein NlpD